MTLENRILQFKKMAEADPNNELAHFSLGKACLEAGDFAAAAGSLERVLAINPSFSRAYQHLGEVQLKLGRHQDAIATLSRGYSVAQGNGDIMPRDAIGGLLKELGVARPVVGEAVTAVAAEVKVKGNGEFQCRRCGGGGPKLPERPFKGQMGERILAEICSTCWREWIGMGTKVINEFRLDLSNPHGQQVYDQEMREFLNLA
jgi:Fe-S cluster biosynthesis and repair protein YggX